MTSRFPFCSLTGSTVAGLVAAVLVFPACSSALRGQEERPIHFRNPRPESWREERACGATSAYVFLRLHDVRLAYRDVLEAMPISERGTSFHDVMEYCNAAGCKSRIVKVSAKGLRNVECPAIAHLKSSLPNSTLNDAGHYVVVVRASESGVTLIDPSVSLKIIDVAAERFAKLYSGHVLVSASSSAHAKTFITVSFLGLCVSVAALMLMCGKRSWRWRTGAAALGLFVIVGCGNRGSSTPTSLDHGIVADDDAVDLGLLNSSPTSNEARFSIHNGTQESCDLEPGRPNCTCTRASVEPRSLAPGGDAVVTMTIRSDREPGPVVSSLAVATTDGSWSRIFDVKGFVAGLNMPDRAYLASDGTGVITGAVFTTDKIARWDVKVEEIGAAAPSIAIEPPTVGAPRPIYDGKYSHNDITIRLKAIQAETKSRVVPRVSTLNVSLRGGGDEFRRTIVVISR